MKTWAQKKHHPTKNSGFTIVELLIVIIVIGILATLILVAYRNVTDQAKVTTLKGDLTQAGKQLNIDKERGGGAAYPATLAAANGGNGITPSAGATYIYNPDNTTNPPTYCLQETLGSQTYYITGTGNIASAPISGACNITNGLIAWWKLNGDTNDASGNNVAATNNGATPTTGQNGQANSAYSFNGTSSYIGTSQQLMNSVTNFSLGGWINMNSSQISRAGFFGHNDNVETQATGNAISFYQNGVTVNCAMTAGAWHMVYGVFNGSTLAIYIDGTQCASSASTQHNSAAYNFNIGGGGIADSSANWFTGSIDDVRVYNRALSSTELQTLYQIGAQ